MQEGVDADEVCVVHLEPGSSELNRTRLVLGGFGLGAAWTFLAWATGGDVVAAIADGFQGSAPDGTPYWGQAVVPAVVSLLLVVAMPLRSIGLAWGALMLLAFLGVAWVTSVGPYPLVLALVLFPAVWDYHQMELDHRRTEPIGRVPVDRRTPQP